ncbi:MAG: S8 family serine peptidase [Thermosphaera sp.]
MKRILVLISIIFLLGLITPMTPASSTIVPGSSGFGKTYVSPVLFEDSFWSIGAYAEDSDLLSFTPVGEEFTIVNRGIDTGRVIIVLEKNTPLTVLKGKTRGIIGAFPTHIYNIVFAVIVRDQVEPLSRTPGVLAILPDVRIDALINKEMKQMETYIDETPLQGGDSEPMDFSNYHYTLNITGAIDVWSNYNIMGEDVKLAIIDTGVDYGSPGLGLDAIARDEYGLPLVFDVSSLGLVLTPVVAQDVGDGYIYVNASELYVFQPPYYVFKWTNQLWARVSGCRSASIWVPFPSNSTWYIGNIMRYGPVKFGLMLQYISLRVGPSTTAPPTTLWLTVPVIVVDSNGDGVYDTLYADTTTALYLIRQALSPSPCSVTFPGTLGTTADFSFADEEPIRYGNEVIARDLDGDGITDFSIGTLAGYVYDASFAIILDKIGAIRANVLPLDPLLGISIPNLAPETWRGEPVAYVWPGLDPEGDYVVIQYDYNSHGTYCANTAAGRDFYAQTGYGVRSIAGQAPRVKIAAAPALYYGTVAAAIYFFSGFDIITPYGDGSIYLWPAMLANPWIAFEGYTWKWEYIGEHQVDITSNSYGSSGWALWGWNTGMDPSSIIFDYTIMTSGTMHFAAVGNGGPGYGTVSTPASSTLAMGVGAATEFTYRPLYGYSWPGSSRQVITWSNRGPTELGVVKPDIVAVGSFAWAVGRTWDALNNVYGVRRLSGTLAYNLFSGTSQATPMSAGVGALVVSAYKAKYGERMPPHLLKTVLMNTATDMGFDELSQGAGFVNAFRAVKSVLEGNTPLVYSTSIFNDMLSEISSSYPTIAYDSLPVKTWFEPKIFIPSIRAGARASRPLTVEGPGSYEAYSIVLKQVSSLGLCDISLANLNPTVISNCTGESLVLNVSAATSYGHLILDLDTLRSYDYFEIEVVFPFQFFESGGRGGAFNVMIPTTVVELAYWIDVNKDGVFAWSETARMMYDIRRANAVRIQYGDLEGSIAEIERLAKAYMDVDPQEYPRYLIVRLGVSGATFRGDLPVKARVVGYNYTRWDAVSLNPSRFTLTTGSRTITVQVKAPSTPGFYSGYIVVEEKTRGLRYLVPISFFVPIEIRSTRAVSITPFEESTPMKNTYLRGAFDYTWRYESGDWRVFKIIVPPTFKNLWALGIRVSWPTYDNPRYASNLDVHLYGPYTYYMVDNETFAVYEFTAPGLQLAAELSLDPTRSSSYNPSRFWDSVAPGESFIISPMSGPGSYRLVVRNIQFSGVSYIEPFTIQLLPVSLSSVKIHNPATGKIHYTVIITGPLDLQPELIDYYGEVLFKPITEENMYYVSDPSIVSLDINVGYPSVTPNRFRFTTTISYTSETPPGSYIIPLSALMKYPVTTVGWLNVTTPTVYFEWYEIPIYLRLDI